MNRRQFLASAAAAGSFALNTRQLRGDQHCDCRTFATPDAARKSPPEQLGYVLGLYAGTDIKKPDYLATIDLNPASPTYSQVIHRLPMPNVGDELHHFGWNACASCHGQRSRRYLIVPGIVSGRIHIVDTATPEPQYKVINPTKPFADQAHRAHTVLSCGWTIDISMLRRQLGTGGFRCSTEVRSRRTLGGGHAWDELQP